MVGGEEREVGGWIIRGADWSAQIYMMMGSKMDDLSLLKGETTYAYKEKEKRKMRWACATDIYISDRQIKVGPQWAGWLLVERDYLSMA